jgi:hypothetical protein
MASDSPAPGQRGPLPRRQFNRLMRAVSRANAPGKDDRIAAARAKRDRKNAKRAEARA